MDFLLAQGYTILETNYRYRKAEIDIISKKGDTLAIVEVKTRGKGFMVPLNQAISRKKIKLLVLAADHFVRSNGLDCEVRFDILAITFGKSTPRIEHLKDAFYHF